jgi:hypothetical protein
MLVKEQLVLKLVVKFLVVLRNYIGRNTLVLPELAAEGHHCAEGEVLPLDLSPGAIGKQCLKRCAN